MVDLLIQVMALVIQSHWMRNAGGLVTTALITVTIIRAANLTGIAVTSVSG
jgi:hypothetical protein